MCGIAGWALTESLPAETTSSVLSIMEQRGPDDQGWLSLAHDEIVRGAEVTASIGPTALLHRRLAIIDLTENGHEPMSSADGRLHIAYNGEVYNYIELREQLQKIGHDFSTNTDTEVVLAAFQEWGVQSFRRFEGMFAMAILDSAENRIWLVRDAFGIKPLYVNISRRGVSFASSIEAMLEFPGISRRMQKSRIQSFLAGEPAANPWSTFFRDIRQVPAGSWECYDADGGALLDSSKWWTWPGDAPKVTSQQLQEEFLSSVRRHLRSDVPVGVALSGGIDSSAVVAAIRQHLGEEVPIAGFSFIASDAALSEEKWVDLMASAANVHVHKIRATGQDLVTDLGPFLRAQGEPTETASPYAQYKVFQRAKKEGITVLLDGQGADEMFAGYDHHLGARWADLVRRGRLLQARKFMAACAKRGRSKRAIARHGASLLSPPGMVAKARQIRALGGDPLPGWVTTEGQSTQVSPRPHGLRSALQHAFQSGSLPRLLQFEDRNSMAWSIESRVPFLTPNLVTIAAGLTDEQLIDNEAVSKASFREAMMAFVPSEILQRKDKIGFAATEATWMRDTADQVEDILQTASTLPILDSAKLMEAWKQFARGDNRNSKPLWRTMTLLAWVQQFDAQW